MLIIDIDFNKLNFILHKSRSFFRTSMDRIIDVSDYECCFPITSSCFYASINCYMIESTLLIIIICIFPPWEFNDYYGKLMIDLNILHSSHNSCFAKECHCLHRSNEMMSVCVKLFARNTGNISFSSMIAIHTYCTRGFRQWRRSKIIKK